MVKLIGSALKIVMFFLSLWGERSNRRAKKKAEVANEIVEAFKETNPKKQASRLNSAIGSINRLRR